MPEIPLPDPPLDDGAAALRPWGWEDAPAIVAACQDPEIPRWTEVPKPYTDQDAQDFLVRLEPDRRAGRALSLAVCRSGDGAALGSCGLQRFDWRERKAEVGYWIAPDARREELGWRATRLLSRWALEQLRLERIELLSNPENEASQRLAERAGFSREGVLRSFRPRPGGERETMVMFSLLPGDLRGS
jgi:RimJ/RimL family protein N-acetyltransferase